MHCSAALQLVHLHPIGIWAPRKSPPQHSPRSRQEFFALTGANT
jgi:hypothetical protein